MKNQVRKADSTFLKNGLKADSALGIGIDILSSRKSWVGFPMGGAKVDSAFCSDQTVVSLHFVWIKCIGFLLLLHFISDVTKT